MVFPLTFFGFDFLKTTAKLKKVRGESFYIASNVVKLNVGRYKC